jgi:hypothetical protein
MDIKSLNSQPEPIQASRRPERAERGPDRDQDKGNAPPVEASRSVPPDQVKGRSVDIKT